MTRFVALLRGINVGGNNLIKMTELKACFERQGLRDVTTYIASGNVVFASNDASRDELTSRIERAIQKTFGCKSSVVLRTDKQMREIVLRVPAGFGKQPAKYRYDVIFLKEPLTAATAMKSVRTKPGVDQAHAGAGVLYFSRLIEKATQSQLGKLVWMPVYKSMTIRNWNTTTKLFQMLK